MSCCHDAHLALTPYEIVRLSRNLNLSTTAFIDLHLIEGGMVLRNSADGGCSLLGEDRCRVYADRPLVCRTYPLLRVIREHGESFARFTPFPTTLGVYGEDGTVGDFLAEHQVAEFISAHDRYFAVLQEIIGSIADAITSAPNLFPVAREIIERRTEFRAITPSRLMDVDILAGDYCRNRGRALPLEIDELIDLHVMAIEEIVEEMRRGVTNDGSPINDDIVVGMPRWENQFLELSELAGALGAAADANVMLMLTSAVLGLPNRVRADTSK